MDFLKIGDGNSTYMSFSREPHSLLRDDYVAIEKYGDDVWYDDVKNVKFITHTFIAIECKSHYIYIEQDEGKIYVMINDMDDNNVHKLVFNTIHVKGSKDNTPHI
jgi:hypothetical protein